MKVARIAVVATATIMLALAPSAMAAQKANGPTGTVTVSAAASLTDVLPVIARAFEKRFPGVIVKFNFGGSSALVEQVIAGAPVDVIATASESTLWKATNLGLTRRPLLFAKNTMAIAMPKDNPARVRQLSDLQNPGVLVGLCAASVPCGSAANQVIAKSALNVKPVTLELDVRALLGKIIAGELDAGIVYVTDIRSAGNSISSVAIPRAQNVVTTYPVAAVTDAPNPAAAAAFVSYLRYTPSAQGILRAYGFAKPW